MRACKNKMPRSEACLECNVVASFVRAHNMLCIGGGCGCVCVIDSAKGPHFVARYDRLSVIAAFRSLAMHVRSLTRLI